MHALKGAERALRRALTRALSAGELSGGALSGGARAGSSEPAWDPARLRRIAVLRLDRRLGNQIILLPLLDALHRACPQAEIEVLAPGPYHEVFLHRASVGRVTRLERSRLLGPHGLRRVLELRARGVDLILEAGHHHSFSLSGALLARASGAPLRMGFRRGESPAFLNILVDAPQDRNCGRARTFFELARRVDPQARYASPRWESTPEERRWALEMRSRLELGPRAAGVHPGGRGARRWEPGRFEQVARGLEERGFQPLIFLGPAEREQRGRWRALAAERAARGWRVIDPPPPLRPFAALVSTLSCWVSGDTGPLHLAVACGVPAVGVLRHREGLEALEPGKGYAPVFAEGEGPSVEQVLRALDTL